MDQTGISRFHEEQSMRQWWVLLLIAFVAVLQWWGFVEQIVLGRPWGSRPAPDWVMVLLWLLFGIGLPLFLLYVRLVVTVTDESIDVRYRPLTRRIIPITEVAGVRARTYSPIREYGGWGLRGFGGVRAYSVSGNRGVELTLRDGRKVLIGSQRADDLADAIAAARGHV